MSDTFSPDSFLAATTVESLETKFTPLPEGEYPATLEAVAMKNGISEKSGNPWYMLNLTWNITADSNPVVKQVTGLDNVKVRQQVFIDMTEQGGLATGKAKNIQLGKIREALGQNTPGRPWSPNMMIGQGARVMVKHRADQRDPSNIFAEVSQVTRLN